MTSRKHFAVVSVLLFGIPACLGEVSRGESAHSSEQGGTSASTDTNRGNTSTSRSSATTTPDAGADSGATTTTGGATTVAIDSTQLINDGAIATDGTTVFWVTEDVSESGDQRLVSCPVTGCPSGGPNTLWGQVNWGDGPGELVVQNGLVYFQEAMSGPIYDCPTSGCGAGPTEFVAVASTPAVSAALASDGTNLYWVDSGAVHACALGATCSAPRVVASLATGAWITAIDVSGPNLYWVTTSASGYSSVLETAPIAGGSVSTVCKSLFESPGTVAVVGDYAYVTTGRGSGRADVYRCAISGGAPTVYFNDPGPYDIATDGTNLYWLSRSNEAEDVILKSCAPGATCESPTSLFDTLYTTGFALYSNDIYSVSGQVYRTTVP